MTGTKDGTHEDREGTPLLLGSDETHRMKDGEIHGKWVAGVVGGCLGERRLPFDGPPAKKPKGLSSKVYSTTCFSEKDSDHE